jgi:hypothetical protein
MYTNVLSEEDLHYINTHPSVLLAKESIEAKSSGMVYFSVPLIDSIRTALQTHLGIDLRAYSQIPMRWIKGDISPHVDVAQSTFQNTYLLYMTDSPGQLIVGSESYPIHSNTGFVFNEGLSHETVHTETVPRLLLGPMNEFAQPVGSPLTYYSTEADALNSTNPIGQSSDFVVGSGGPYGGFTSWRLASNSSGTSPQNAVYNDGYTLANDGSYYLYPSAPCFLEGSTILCQVHGVEQYIAIEQLTTGMLVKTHSSGYKPVALIGHGTIENPGDNERTKNRLYKCSLTNYPDLKHDLYITGCHSILVSRITDKEKEALIGHLGKVFITEDKYRLIACVDERAEPWNSKGTYNIWHFALENENESMNYGVYANGGLLVESCSINFLKTKSNLTLS